MKLLTRFGHCLFVLCFATAPVFGQSYKIVPNITSIAAGNYATNIHATLAADTSTTLDVGVCFYTGYGSIAPIVPTFAYRTSGAELFFSVPSSTIQEVPPSAFSNGTFSAILYTVPLSASSCTGAGQAGTNAFTVSLQYPTLTSISLASVSQQNPNLTTRLPSSLQLRGGYFLSASRAAYPSPSVVTFRAPGSSAVAGDVTFINSTGLISSIPSGIPAAASSVEVAVCNTAVYSYCTAPITLLLTPLQSDFGTLTPSLSSAAPTQPVALSATFGPATPSSAGAPGGLVQFIDTGAPLASVPLQLDTTASFIAARNSPLPISSLPVRPLLADLNRDGIPDLILVEPNAITNGVAFPVIHILLGTTPTGQFAPDNGFYGLGDIACATLLDTVLADFNSDGFPDLAVLCSNPPGSGPRSEVLYTLLNKKNGAFSYEAIAFGPVYGTNLAAADFNHDGKSDIVLSGSVDATGNTGLQVLLGKGDGSFTAGPVSTGLDTASGTGFQIAAADFNLDGFPDLAMVNSASAIGSVHNLIQVFQNDGTGKFSLATTVPTDGSNSAHFFAAPLSAGQPPALIEVSVGSGVSVAHSRGTASIAFDGTLQANAIPGLTNAIIGDFNGDGLLDIAISDATTSRVLTGDGNGIFAADYPGLSVTPRVGSTLLAASDQNSDGYDDLLQVYSGLYTATIYDYITAGTATAAIPSITLASGYHRIVASTPGTPLLLGAAANTTISISGNSPGVVLTTSVALPAAYGTPVTIYGTVLDPTATGTVSFFNGNNLIGTAMVASSGLGAVATITPPLLSAGSYNVTAVYSGDATHTTSKSLVIVLKITPIPVNIAWSPSAASIPYGLPLSAAQLNAVVDGLGGASVSGSFVYTPASGAILKAGPQSLSVTFTPTNPNYTAVTSTAAVTITRAITKLTWSPNPAAIVYGTALSAAQLDAYGSTANTASVPGSFTYTPASGSVLATGPHSIAVTFTPADTADFTAASASASITVSQATPVITWPAPADVIVDTTLSSTQLDATAATPQGAALPGTFTYSPPSGTELSVAGALKLSVVFTPTDTANFTTTTASVTINVGPIGITSVTPATALLGDSAKTITISGTGFSPTSKVQVVGPSLPAELVATNYISSTSLAAVIPAADFLVVEKLQVSIFDPTKDLPSNALPFAVTAPSTSVAFNAPPSISPASQNSVVFHLDPYPVPVTANVAISFKPEGSLPDDPGIVFVDSGLRTDSATVAAHSAVYDLPVTFQSGTVAGILTLTLTLQAGGADVTPASVKPIVIPEPAAVPGISSVTLKRDGDTLSVTTRGYSNSRVLNSAAFHFAAAPGSSVGTPGLIVDPSMLFVAWYADPSSSQYGSQFTYTEVFNLSSDASSIGQVTVTLSNDVGNSQEANTP